MLSLKFLPMDMIDIHPENNKIFSVSNIEHLATLIKEEGFHDPIEVYEKEDGRYGIISGHRRYAAMQMLGRETIPCIITENSGNNDIKKLLISSNLATRVNSPLEIAFAISAYKEAIKDEPLGEYKSTREKIASFFNMPESKIHRYLCLLKLVPELQEFCKNPAFQFSSLQQAANLSVEEQYRLIDEMKLLESSERKIEIEDIDTSELIFTRTKVENIISNIIRKKESTQTSPNMDEENKTTSVPEQKIINDTDLTEDNIFVQDFNLSNEEEDKNIEIIEDNDDFISLDDKKDADNEINKIKNYFEVQSKIIVDFTDVDFSKISDQDKSDLKKRIDIMKMTLYAIEKNLI